MLIFRNMFAAIFPNLSQPGYQWLYFGVIIGTVFICGLVVFLWISFVPKRRKRKRRHHGHGRINPTRAEVGGLPPPKPAEERRDADPQP